MIYHMAYVQYSLTALVSLNRLSVLLKTNSEKVWKRYIWVIVVFVYLAPFLNTKLVFYYDVEITYYEDVSQYTLISVQLPGRQIFSVLIPFMILTMSMTVIFNLGSIIFLRGLSIQRKQAESKFLFITIITCFVQLIGTMISVPLAVLEVSPLLMKFSLVTPFISDCLSLIQPWLLICFSTAMRQEVKTSLGFQLAKKNQNVQQVQSITS